MGHRLLELLTDAADGRFPPVDGGVTMCPPLADGREAVVAFTGHAVIASRLGIEDLADLRPDGFGRALDPRLLVRLAGDGTIGTIDITMVTVGTGGGSLPPTSAYDHHPRVHHARQLRHDVRVFGDERGLVTLGVGLAGRVEMGVEVVGDVPRHTGRQLIREAIALVPAGRPLFAAVSPGNARSVRSFLAEGFVPLGSEVIVTPARPR